MSASEDELQAVRTELRDADAIAILEWANQRFGSTAVIASSFGAEDVVLIDLAARAAPQLEIFTLDTGRLHPETYETLEAIRRKYQVRIKSYFPIHQSVESLENEKGLFSFRESLAHRKECCAIRKLEPLQRALAGRHAWLTGLRKAQSPTRTGVEAIELDATQSGIWKINPLANWTEQQVWDHIRANGVPYHPLHDRGFPSIGCAPCTRAVKPGEDLRAGRWWWESADHKECGLHPGHGGGN